jgi:hypothetical protein
VRWALLAAAAVVVALALAPGASARFRDRYCSPTGDYCTSAQKQAGAVKLTLSTFSFSGRYRLCVKPTVGVRTCKSFPLRRRGDVWRSVVTWHRNFPNRGTGFYRVTWFYGGVRLGPPLNFAVANS